MLYNKYIININNKYIEMLNIYNIFLRTSLTS